MAHQFLGFTHKNIDPFSPLERLYLDEDERRKTHMLVLGSSGEGKSKFLEWLIRGDIRNCQGLCLLDLHGTLYGDLKKWLSYNYDLMRNVILLDPSGGQHVKGYNPFRPKKDVAINVQVAGMVQALTRVWGQENTNQTPTLERVLTLVFYAMIVRDIPIHEIFYLVDFNQREVRADVISTFTEPVVVSAWQQIQELKGRGQWRDEVLSTENRLFRMAHSQTIKRFMGVMDESFNLDVLDIMNQGKILLVNLKESNLLYEEEAETFAVLLLNDFFKTSIMFRDRDTLKHDPLPFHVYLDEWQNVVTPDIAKILAQARKFGLLLTLANQDLSQIAKAFDDNFVNTLLSLCKVKACFGGLNRKDATRMVDEMLVGQIDLNETKYLLTATKFWPTYHRDVVFTTSRALSEPNLHTKGRSSGMVIGAGAASANSLGSVWNSYEGCWIPSENASTVEASNFSQIESDMEAVTSGSIVSEAEAVANVPILMPVPFEEVISRTTYTLEEQRFLWSDRFMQQYPRHCYIKLPRQNTLPMEVPFVDEYFVTPEMQSSYERDLAEVNQAKQPEEVDALLDAQPTLFLPKPAVRALSEPKDEDLYE